MLHKSSMTLSPSRFTPFMDQSVIGHTCVTLFTSEYSHEWLPDFNSHYMKVAWRSKIKLEICTQKMHRHISGLFTASCCTYQFCFQWWAYRWHNHHMCQSEQCHTCTVKKKWYKSCSSTSYTEAQWMNPNTNTVYKSGIGKECSSCSYCTFFSQKITLTTTTNLTKWNKSLKS